MAPEISELTRSQAQARMQGQAQARRCVLFIGVSPREPLVRQLCQKLLDRRVGTRRSQGPTYFLLSTRTARSCRTGRHSIRTGSAATLIPFLCDLIEASK